MPRATRDTAPSVNLFPFLAVLLCMMGALVFLLIALATRVGVEPVSIGDDEVDSDTRAVLAFSLPAPPPEPIVLEPEVIRPPLTLPEPVIHDADVVSARQTQADVDAPLLVEKAQLEQTLAARRLSISTAEDAARVSADALARATQRRRDAELARQRSAQRRRLAEAKLAESQDALKTAAARLKNANDDLERAAEAPRARATKFRVLPIDRVTGTQRYPIVVECTGAGYRFAIENVDVPKAVFQGQTVQANSLLHVINALTVFYTEKGERPYVLLVVRPSGTDAFHIAQWLLNKTSRKWGYELIDESLPLSWPKPPQGARDTALAALERSQRVSPVGEPLDDRGDVFASRRVSVAKQRRRTQSSDVGYVATKTRPSKSTAPTPQSGANPYHVAAQTASLSRSVDVSRGKASRRNSNTVPATPASAARSNVTPSDRRSRPRDTKAKVTSGEDGWPSDGVPTEQFVSSKTPRPKFRRWGQSSPDQWIGYEKMIDVTFEGDTLIAGGVSVTAVDAQTKAVLVESLTTMLDAVSSDWEPPLSGTFWRPVLVLRGPRSPREAKLRSAADELQVGVRYESRSASSERPGGSQ